MAFRIKMGGKPFKFANLPEDVKEKIADRLAAKDKVLAQGRKGILPGIKINGKTVDQKFIDSIDLTKRSKPVKGSSAQKPAQSDSKFTKEELETKASSMGFREFRKWAKKTFHVTGRSISGLINDILKSQER